MVLSEKTLYSLGRRCVYIFNRWKAKKEIPVNQYPRAALESEPISPEPPALPKHKTFFDRIVGRFRR